MAQREQSKKKKIYYVFLLLFCLVLFLGILAAVAVKLQIIPLKSSDSDADADWELGKKSGKEEDFNKYFNVTIKDYNTKQKGTKLGTIESITYTYLAEDKEAYVYLPPDYSTDKVYPVLYMIHGMGESREQWINCKANEIISNMICNKEVKPLIAVFPTVEDCEEYEDEFANGLEPYILENYPVSTEQKDTGVCGLSVGGTVALHLGFLRRDHFNYIGAFSPPEMEETYETLLSLRRWNTTPQLIFLCSGDDDRVVADTPQNFHIILVKNQVDHIWYLYPEAGHNTIVWMTGLVNFLKMSYQ